jgi:hypothetical protein
MCNSLLIIKSFRFYRIMPIVFTFFLLLFNVVVSDARVTIMEPFGLDGERSRHMLSSDDRGGEHGMGGRNIWEIRTCERKSPNGEGVHNAVDEGYMGKRNTKYLNFCKTGHGFGVGFDHPEVVNNVVFVTANDAPERDPTRVEISGRSTERGPWQLIDEIDLTPPAGRHKCYGDPQSYQTADAIRTGSGEKKELCAGDYFDNETPYKFYKFIITKVRDNNRANSFQFSEVAFFSPSNCPDNNIDGVENFCDGNKLPKSSGRSLPIGESLATFDNASPELQADIELIHFDAQLTFEEFRSKREKCTEFSPYLQHCPIDISINLHTCFQLNEISEYEEFIKQKNLSMAVGTLLSQVRTCQKSMYTCIASAKARREGEDNNENQLMDDVLQVVPGGDIIQTAVDGDVRGAVLDGLIFASDRATGLPIGDAIDCIGGAADVRAGQGSVAGGILTCANAVTGGAAGVVVGAYDLMDQAFGLISNTCKYFPDREEKRSHLSLMRPQDWFIGGPLDNRDPDAFSRKEWNEVKCKCGDKDPMGFKQGADCGNTKFINDETRNGSDACFAYFAKQRGGAYPFRFRNKYDDWAWFKFRFSSSERDELRAKFLNRGINNRTKAVEAQGEDPNMPPPTGDPNMPPPTGDPNMPPPTGIDPAEYACGTPIAHTHDVCLNNFATAPENTMKFWNEGLDWAKKASDPDEEEWRRIKMQCQYGEGMKWEEDPANRSDPLLFRNNCKEHEGTTVYLDAPS